MFIQWLKYGKLRSRKFLEFEQCEKQEHTEESQSLLNDYVCLHKLRVVDCCVLFIRLIRALLTTDSLKSHKKHAVV